MLHQLRFSTENSRGRRYPEPPHPYRDPYQRDRDRIIHARAFRRLEHKTQVFTLPHSDHSRNRLTHTIEVTQIARTVAAALGLNEPLTEALALSHDIGHPPFGHAGEDVLDLEMRKYGSRFDHNLHALRIVESFEQRYAGFPGLNLTFEVREGIIKHSRDYEAAEHPELAEYLLDDKPPLEAQIIDLADEVTYNCADLDDAVEAGLLKTEQVRESVAGFDEAIQLAKKSYPGAAPRQLFNEALRSLLDQLVSGLIRGTAEKVAAAKVASSEGVRCQPQRLASFSAEAAAVLRPLRTLLVDRVYNSPPLALERQRTGERLAQMFQFLAASPDRLPNGHRQRLAADSIERVVCDYIAGMTDKFFLRCYAEVFGAERSSV